MTVVPHIARRLPGPVASSHTLVLAITMALVMALVAVGPLHAQQASSWVPVDSAYAGDRFPLVVELGHDGTGKSLFPHELLPDSLVSGPLFRIPLGDFLLLSVRSQGGRTLTDGVRLDSVVYEATTFAIDTARVDAIPVGLVAGVDTSLVLAEGVWLRIASLLTEARPELRDITDLALFPRAWWPWILGLVLGLLAAWLVWRHYKSGRQDATDTAPEAHPDPPVEIALARLAALEAVDLRSIPDIKAWYVELTLILRTYFAERAEVPALEATTRELITELTRLRADRPVPREWIAALQDVLQEADLVKFADIRPVVDKTQLLLRSSRETIEETERAYRRAEEKARQRELEAARRREESASSTPQSGATDRSETHGATDRSETQPAAGHEHKKVE